MQTEHQRGPRRGVPLSELDPDVTNVSGKVIGACIEVHKALGPGYGRDVYLHAVVHEVKKEGVTCEVDKAFDVVYDDAKVGEIVADLFVDGKFIVKLMAEHREIGTQPRAELRAQLRAADIELGNIINFGERRLKDGLVRVLNPDKLSIHHDDED
ncbi:MAG: hypothetical protein DHS20C14_08460 [Phycisphaeraceae bacterium]|nr:MAG: hypothetical protein DHS20C14_08460 [Phycisphaeraceae bacterium]